jgi:hypothetical protein
MFQARMAEGIVGSQQNHVSCDISEQAEIHVKLHLRSELTPTLNKSDPNWKSEYGTRNAI